MRAVLSATHAEWISPTIYSYICDLKTLTVHVYQFHDFEAPFVFDLRAELAKGAREYDLSSLFKFTPFAAVQHEARAPKLGVREIEQKLAEGGVDAAFSWYESIKTGHRDLPNYTVYEPLIQQLGNDLMARNKTKEALDVFRFRGDPSGRRYG